MQKKVTGHRGQPKKDFWKTVAWVQKLFRDWLQVSWSCLKLSRWTELHISLRTDWAKRSSDHYKNCVPGQLSRTYNISVPGTEGGIPLQPQTNVVLIWLMKSHDLFGWGKNLWQGERERDQILWPVRQNQKYHCLAEAPETQPVNNRVVSHLKLKDVEGFRVFGKVDANQDGRNR